MRSHRFLSFALVLTAMLAACNRADAPAQPAQSQTPPAPASPADRKSLLETVGDAAVVQLYTDGFSSLPLGEKTLIWHLYQAAIAGRDIFSIRNTATRSRCVPCSKRS